MKTMITVLMMMCWGCYKSDYMSLEMDAVQAQEQPSREMIIQHELRMYDSTDACDVNDNTDSTDDEESIEESTMDAQEPLPLCVPEDECVEWCIAHDYDGGRCWIYDDEGDCKCLTIRSSCECL